ncbi:MAG TPA: hypothetical protein VNW90_19160 [Acetobacteraceae bacterium]|nr:hypothetical protein [Acetobacteraceae bacterium]
MRYLPMTEFVDHDDNEDEDEDDDMTMTYEQEHRLVHTARHLTGAEMERLLARYDLPETAGRILGQYEMENAWGLFEMWCEQIHERGHAKRHYTRLEEYQRAHPVHGPVNAPPPVMVHWDDDDVPF